MRKTKQMLLVEFVATVIAAMAVVGLFEWGTDGQGCYAHQVQADFIVETVMVLLTIVAIPLALRLFRFRRVRAALQLRKERALRIWGTLRILMLGVPLVANVVCYYLFCNPGYSYLALILFLSMLFVFPTLERCYAETEPDTTPETE